MSRKKPTPLPPVTPPPPPDPSADPPNLVALDARKKQLEIDKLEQEVATSREARVWWRKSIRDVKLSEWLTAAAAIVALAAAFWTGLFNTIRERLSAQTDRLAVEKIDLEQKKEKLGAEIAAKEKELVDVKARLLPYEQEAGAIQDLRGFKGRLLDVSFGVTAEHDGYRVTIDGRDEKLDWTFESKSRLNPHLPDALRAVNRLRSLKGLRLRGLHLGLDHLPLVCQHREIETLVLREAGLDQQALAVLTRLPYLKSLRLDLNNISSLEGCGPLPQVQYLSLSGNPLGDTGLAKFATVFPNVEWVDLTNTQVTDAGMAHLASSAKLHGLDLTGTKVTGNGLVAVVSPRTLSIRVNKGAVSEEARAILNKKNPNSLSLIELDTRELIRNTIQGTDRW